MTIDDIANYYKKCLSLRQTVRDLDLNFGTVRKALITRGLWTSPRIEEIAELRKQGLSTKEIAEQLQVSKTCVNNNSAFERDTYLNENKTKNAIRLKRWGEKQKEKS